MRRLCFWLGSAAFLAPTGANAADQLKFGPAPEWVVPQTIPAASAAAKDRPVAILLHDQQTYLKPGAVANYSELAFKIQKPEGLAAGNLSIQWDPAIDTATVNKLEIRRGDQVIDVLKSGQTFTTMRRETNLELAMLDGILTANIQPEGLREGDVIVMATTIERADPVLKGHVETSFGAWGQTQIALAHARLRWTSGLKLKTRKTADLPPPLQQTASDGLTSYELTMRNTEPVIPPKGAPLRFRIGRLGEATDFQSWSDAARLMIPLYKTAAVIPPSGPLRDEVEKIRKTSSDPRIRTAMALALVQNRIRYVALSMGEGGWVPASAQTTWERRFGDCKAKTALLLALLHELGVQAEPVAASIGHGDAIADRLPMIGVFNHVLVRAHLGGKEYWLDGTKTGDAELDSIDIPDFGWVLPILENAALVHLVPSPLSQPDSDTTMVIDATKGVRAPVDVHVEQILRGDGAVGFNLAMNALADSQRAEFFNEYWNRTYNFVTPGTTDTAFDPVKKAYRISMHGTGKLDWSNGWFHMPHSTVGFAADFDRTSASQRDAPVEVNYPNYSHTSATIRFPPGFFGSRPTGSLPATHETLAGVEYSMHESHESGPAADILTIETSAHSIAPEIAYKDAIAAEPRLRQLADQDSAIPLPRFYRPTKADLDAWLQEKPATANAYLDRGSALMDAKRFDEATADFTQAIVLDPKNVVAFADRALAHVWKNELPEAEKDVVAAKALQVENPVLWRAQGIIAEQKFDYSAAIEAYTASLKGDPNSSFAFGHRAFCYQETGKEDEALADSERALKADPAWMNLRLMRANIYFVRGNTVAVAREAEAMLAENPHSDYAQVAAAKIYARIGRKADALKAFDAALAIKPQPYIYLNRAQIRPFTDYSGRLADLDAALKLDPKDVDSLAEKAEQLAAEGNTTEALKIYDQVSQLAPANDYFRLRRAIILYKSGTTNEAERIITEQRAKAKSASELNSLCWAKATAGILLESALQDCLESLKLRPESIHTLDSLALVDLRLGKTDEAINLYSKAIAGHSGSASYMGRSIAYARKGDKAHSDADRAEAIRLDQDAETRFLEYGLKR